MPRETNPRRPLSQYGTAEEIMHVFRPDSDGNWSRDDFEQAGASNEEMRKIDLTELTPKRPVPGFALGTGTAVDETAMLEAGRQKQ